MLAKAQKQKELNIQLFFVLLRLNSDALGYILMLSLLLPKESQAQSKGY